MFTSTQSTGFLLKVKLIFSATCIPFLREIEKPVSCYRVLLYEAHEHLYILSKTDASVFKMYFSVTYSRKTTGNYDYEQSIRGKLHDHTYFLKGKQLPLQVSGQKKRQRLDRLNIIAGTF